ncbi:MAG: hypothetical protein VX834_02295, partial [Myxococcota bacterium]|nr:hypothetical protein [Myxococcota bacterium]
MVITPLFGGAHPIAESCQRAFTRLGHEAVLADLRPMQDRYHELKRDSESDESAGALFYSEVEANLIQTLDSFRPDLVFSMALAPLKKSFLDLLRTRSVVSACWFVEDCNRFPMWQWQAGWFDHFFLIQEGP